MLPVIIKVVVTSSFTTLVVSQLTAMDTLADCRFRKKQQRNSEAIRKGKRDAMKKLLLLQGAKQFNYMTSSGKFGSL